MIHVYPINDIKEHNTESTTCECSCSLEIENGEMIIIHQYFNENDTQSI